MEAALSVASSKLQRLEQRGVKYTLERSKLLHSLGEQKAEMLRSISDVPQQLLPPNRTVDRMSTDFGKLCNHLVVLLQKLINSVDCFHEEGGDNTAAAVRAKTSELAGTTAGTTASLPAGRLVDDQYEHVMSLDLNQGAKSLKLGYYIAVLIAAIDAGNVDVVRVLLNEKRIVLKDLLDIWPNLYY